MAAITAAELIYRLSVNTGPGNSTAQPNPNASLGGFISTTVISTTTLNNLFDNVSGTENTNGHTDYRCAFLYNSNPANPLENPTLYVTSEVAGGSSVTVAVDTTATSALGSSTAQALGGPGTETAPGTAVTGLAYSAPTTAATGLAMGNIPSGNVKAFWAKRVTGPNVAAINNDGITFNVTGDTGAL